MKKPEPAKNFASSGFFGNHHPNTHRKNAGRAHFSKLAAFKLKKALRRKPADTFTRF
ncbi:MAG: hypothetical protein MJ196_10870 [Treponemataceae bacterium]|nr:hypothetical protein [Treponemataceae bacterium]